MKFPLTTISVFATIAAGKYLADPPPKFNSSQWANIQYNNPSVAVIPGAFNRSVFDAPWDSNNTDKSIQKINKFINTTSFVAYDDKFFDIIGPDAVIKKVHDLPFQSHEAPCWNPKSKELFFVEWGPPGGNDGEHSWQYILNTETNKLRNVTTNPPTFNAHGCVFYKGNMYIASDGNRNETGSLIKIEPGTLKKTVLLNNYYQQPFMGFNDLDIDEDGNFWLTDSKAGSGRGILPFTPPTNPTIYYVNGTTMRPKAVYITTGNANGIAVGPSKNGDKQVYFADTGASEFQPRRKNPYGERMLWSYDSSPDGVLSNPVLLNNPITYFYDGLRVSRNGWIFAGAGDGVDVIDPKSGLTLGSIRVGGGNYVAVNMAFGRNELWIVGWGGVWHVSGVKERLDRRW
ncbi:hypothetical protein ACHAPJ_009041 [Fusarium lateritium]